MSGNVLGCAKDRPVRAIQIQAVLGIAIPCDVRVLRAQSGPCGFLLAILDEAGYNKVSTGKFPITLPLPTERVSHCLGFRSLFSYPGLQGTFAQGQGVNIKIILFVNMDLEKWHTILFQALVDVPLSIQTASYKFVLHTLEEIINHSGDAS